MGESLTYLKFYLGYRTKCDFKLNHKIEEFLELFDRTYFFSPINENTVKQMKIYLKKFNDDNGYNIKLCIYGGVVHIYNIPTLEQLRLMKIKNICRNF